ncbi:MAG: phospholipase A [bacterium]|nr:phospholipase A [bacterium]
MKAIASWLALFGLLAWPALGYDLQTQGLFKSNYALPMAYEADSPEGRTDQEAKYRISLYQRVYAWGPNAIYFAYTQTSWWQLYDQENSRPFRETNYNPEFFLALPPLDVWGEPWLHLGYEHESNGGREPWSRSWDRIYARYGLDWEGLRLRHKVFFRLPEKAKEYPSDPKGDENPDIVEYYGINEVEVILPLGDLEIYNKIRYNAAEGRGSNESNLTYPSGLPGIFLMLQYFQGYGESLIDYNRQVTKWSVGFSLNRS